LIEFAQKPLLLRHRYGALCAWFVLAVALQAFALTGCKDLSMNKYPAHDYFSGSMLEAARAIDRNDLVEMKKHLQGRDLNEVGAKSMTFMWYAITAKNFPAITALMKLGSKPDENIAPGLGSALQVATESWLDTKLLAALLDGGLSPTFQMKDGTTLLQRVMLAADSRDKTALLLDRGADVNQRDSIGGTALNTAINTLQPDLAIMLVLKGGDVNAAKTNGDSVRWGVQWTIGRQQPGSEMRRKFEALRDVMITKGAKFPADPPAKVREWMKSQGMKVAE
jgi:uncharacterized protein